MRTGIIIFSIIFAFLIFWSYAYSELPKDNVELNQSVTEFIEIESQTNIQVDINSAVNTEADIR